MTIIKNKKYFYLLFLFFIFPLFTKAQVQGLVVSPHIIDEKVLAGDLLKYKVKIINNSERKANLYAMVNDMSTTDGEKKFLNPADLDKNTSIASWIKFKRGVIELMPGEETELDLEINVSATAKPGKYFARIAFPDGSNRPKASENMAKKSFAQIAINIEIKEFVIEKAQVKNFRSLRNVYLAPPAKFNINLNNFGNKDIVPQGNIYIYNRRGEEVAKLNVNKDSLSVAPGKLWEQNISWEKSKGFGKFKAKLELEYGKKDKRDLQDTAFFWLFPWQLLLIFFALSFLFLVLMVVWIFKRTYRHHHYQEEINEKSVEKRNTKVLNLKK